MPVRIQSIQVEQLGPIKRFSMKPGLLNLIYGRNEQGKTFLVEFLLRSLFRLDKRWRMRDSVGTGKVIVSGLDEKKVEFLPHTGHKIDDFWDRSNAGLPPQFHRLLVVKGAEVELSDESSDGVDGTTILKRFLSNQILIDQIQGGISPIISGAQVLEGRLSGQNKPPLKYRNEFSEELKKTDVLFDQIEKGWLSGRRREIEESLKESKSLLDQMEQAKHYLAFQLSSQFRQIESRIMKLDAHRLQVLRQAYHSYQQKLSDLQNKQKEAETLQKESTHYNWLEKAVVTYRQIQIHPSRMPGLVFPILALLSFLGCGVCVYLQLRIPAGCLLLLGAVLTGYYIFRLRRSIQKKPYEDERLALAEGYQFRFGEPLKDIAGMEARLESMRTIHDNGKFLSDQVREGKSEIEKLRIEVDTGISSIAGKSVDENHWADMLSKAEQTLDHLKKEREIGKEQLDKLDVDPSDYMQEDPGIPYSKQKYQELGESVQEIEKELREHDVKLNDLKQRLCDKTGDSISSDWGIIIENLRVKREEAAKEYRTITAEILGKKAVHTVLENLRKDEHNKIAEGLSSETILRPLKQITHRYTGLRLENDKLILADDFHDFPFSDLSTGAQEQVLMALRIGFSLKNLGKHSDPLFLILDDAFQYSDYERREWLVETVVDLARSGWQIFYFTMDDHIRDLFDEAGKKLGEDNYLKKILE